MAISETLNSLKAHLYDRAFSPLSGAFALSWAVWNYKLILVVISNLSPAEKFSLIDLRLYPTHLDVYYYGLLLPIVTALVFIYIYPYPAKWVFQYWKERNKELKIIQQKIDDETPLTKEEERALRESIISQELQFSKERAERESEVKRLRDALTAAQAELTAKAKSIDPKPQLRRIDPSAGEVPRTNETSPSHSKASRKKLSSKDDQIQFIFEAVARSEDGRIYDKSLAAESGLNIVRVQSLLDELLAAEFIYHGGSNPGGKYYTLTAEGRKLAVEKGWA